MEPIKQVPLTCPGHSRPVLFLEYTHVTPDGVFFVSACKDGKPMLRKADTGDWVGTFLGHKGAVWGATIDPEGFKVATASADFSAKLWDAVTGDEIHSFPHPHIVRSVNLSRDGNRMVTACRDKAIRVFDLQNLTSPALVLEGHATPIRCVVFGPNADYVLSSDEEPNITVWNTATGNVVTKLQTQHPVTSIELSYDATCLTIASGQTVQIWSADTLVLLKTYTLNVDVEAVSLHPLKDRFVVGSINDFSVRVIDAKSGAELEVLKGHFGPVHCVRYSPEGTSFASGSEDGTIRIWQSETAAQQALPSSSES